jgi:hypothetical protein
MDGENLSLLFVRLASSFELWFIQNQTAKGKPQITLQASDPWMAACIEVHSGLSRYLPACYL